MLKGGSLMNAEHINPFIEGAQNILSMVCAENTHLGKVFLKSHPYACEEVSIAIGIIGQLDGSVVFNMKESTACNIASKMMMGMPVPALDEMSSSAISELTNMISGNVATIFSAKGINIDITPPSFKKNAVDSDFKVSTSTKIICIPLNFENGNIFEIDIFSN